MSASHKTINVILVETLQEDKFVFDHYLLEDSNPKRLDRPTMHLVKNTVESARDTLKDFIDERGYTPLSDLRMK